MELNRKTLLISSGIAILLIGIIIALVIYFKPVAVVTLESLQTKINDLVSGKIAINNLKVINVLTVNNNNANDAFTLKLINNSDKNVITFFVTGNATNSIGVQSAPANLPSSSNIPNQLVLSQPVSITDQQMATPTPNPTKQVGTPGYIQQQLDSIIAGKLPLNNLKVNGTLTMLTNSEYPINLINASGSTNLNSCAAFVKNNTITGYFGVSANYQSNNVSVHDTYSVNVSYSNKSWDLRPSPSCVPRADPTPIPTQSPSIDSLNSYIDYIINGNIPILNLSVNGDVTVTGDSDSLLLIDTYNCDPTKLVTFNSYTNSAGVNGNAGGVWGGDGTSAGWFNASKKQIST